MSMSLRFFWAFCANQRFDGVRQKRKYKRPRNSGETGGFDSGYDGGCNDGGCDSGGCD